MPIIVAEDLTKEFKVFKRKPGFRNTIGSLFHREYEIKQAVDHVSFSIDKGELVGYIGPDGAGKSTTIKMLTGILYPTSGHVTVRGQVPQENRTDNARNIGAVFGQRSQLYWDLPMIDAFELYRKMYKVDKDRFRRNVDFYTELLEMGDFLTRPIRQLSLGQKMRAELAVAMLHDPEIVYLDEPTIGLDVVAKGRIRSFIREVNRERSTTVILTTHDMDDIEQICNRLIMIDEGKLVYDGQLASFKQQYAGENMIIFTHDEDSAGGCKPDLPLLRIVRRERGKKWVLFDPRHINSAEVIRLLMQHYQVLDFTLKEPGIEDILRNIYQQSGSLS